MVNLVLDNNGDLVDNQNRNIYISRGGQAIRGFHPNDRRMFDHSFTFDYNLINLKAKRVD